VEPEEKIVCRVLTGPTASGKTALGVRLAREMGYEILCMDSMQIYRRMDIGTAKPTAEEQQGVPHHLMDLCEPTDSFTVADWRDQADALVKRLWQEKRARVLFVGGTGLYLEALRYALDMGQVPANEERRRELNAMALKPGGREQVHAILSRLDPETGERLHPNDLRRVIRAIEVTETTGVPFSKQPGRKENPDYRWKIVSTAMERSLLYDRIDTRVHGMIESGLREEVCSLLAEGVPEKAQSMSALGYKEMIPHLRGETSLEETIAAIQLGSRHYAKRQMTFLRRMEEISYVDVTRPDAYDRIRAALE